MNKYWEKSSFLWSKDSIRMILTPSTRAKKFLNYIDEIGSFSTFFGYFTERESLNSYLLVYTTEGEGKVIYEGEEVICSKNSVFFIDCKKYQFYSTEKNYEWKFLWIHMNGKNVFDFYEEFRRYSTFCFTAKHDNILLILKDLIELQYVQSGKTEFYNSIMIQRLLTEVLFDRLNFSPDFSKIPDHINQAKLYIDQYYDSKITLNILESISNISKYQLSKEFNQHFGSSPIDYLISVRITQAKELLTTTSCSVQEIASKVGIENAAYFTRIFKNKTTLSPTQYKKLYKA